MIDKEILHGILPIEQLVLINKAEKNCILISGNSTDPTFLGPTLKHFETSEMFSLFLGYFK